MVLSSLITTTTAQDSIPNSGFEDWTNYGTYEDPDNWITLNQATSLSGVVTATKSTDAYSGNYAIRLETKQVITETVPGTAISGALNPLSLLIDIGVPINIRPESMCGWYKYIPFLTDVGSFEIILTKYNPVTKLRDPVGTGVIPAPPANSYTQFSVPIVYLSTDPTDLPDTAVVSLISGSQTFVAGSVLYVDDICLVYTAPPPPSAMKELKASRIRIYPNPASDVIIIESANKVDDKTVFKLYDNAGKLVKISKLKEFPTTINVQDLEAGVYFYNIKGRETLENKSGKIILNR